MKAIGYKKCLPIEDKNALQDIVLEMPKVSGRDLLVEIKAIAVNPVDYKIRQRRAPESGEWAVIGWDAAGVVKEIGSDVTLFKVGDEVWYAGDLNRPGSNAEYQLVDERIVGHKPRSLSMAAAAALPLTTLTAWELLFDRMNIAKNDPKKSILVIGAAGGVGSILVQLVKQLTQLKLICTASRAITTAWLKELNVDVIVNHRNKLSEELRSNHLAAPDYVISLNATEQHFDEIVQLIKPQGKFGFIDGPSSLNIMPFKNKSIATYFEFMYTRSMFQTEDMIEQHNILNETAQLIDEGILRTTLGEHYGKINAANLRKAHAMLESGKAKGKIVLEGF